MADVTVLPSTTMGEAFGLVLVESLACGTPVIASALPGVRTVVDHSTDGLLVQPGNVSDLANSLHTMLTMPTEQRHHMGMLGRHKVVTRYAWHRIGTLLETLYAEVLTERLHQPHCKVNHLVRNGKDL
jgi:glycosyltransferase involved in cell wall biosynthesis